MLYPLFTFLFFQTNSMYHYKLLKNLKGIHLENRDTRTPLHSKPEGSDLKNSCLGRTQILQEQIFEHLFTITHTLKEKMTDLAQSQHISQQNLSNTKADCDMRNKWITQNRNHKANSVGERRPRSGHVQAMLHLQKSSRQRTTLRTVELCQPQPKNDDHGPHVRIQGENALALAGHAPSRTVHHGRGLMLLDRRKSATTMEGHVSQEN